VDGADLNIWQEGFGTGTSAEIAEGDADGDGDVDGGDFLVWQRNIDEQPALNLSTIPEPTALRLTLLGAAAALVSTPARNAIR